MVAKTFPCTDGLTGLIVKYKSTRLTMEHIRELGDNREYHMNRMNPQMKLFRLPDQEGYRCYHTNVATPFFMSNRSYISVNYEINNLDGSLIHLESTKGNGSLLQEFASQLGNDVICDIPLGYSSYRIEEDGMHMCMIVTFRMNGRVPNFFMNFAIRQNT